MASNSITTTYEEPTMVQERPLLVLIGFYYFLQFARIIADYVFSAGLLGEIAVGIIFGGPLAGILPHEWEETWLTVGYLGLVLIVFSGGLDFDAQVFLRSIPIAFIAAFWGVLLPIAFSFAILWKAFGYPILHAFTAGCALSSTSLGTTFFVLQSQTKKGLNVQATRVGTLLTAIALSDDVIALVLLTVVQSLGGGSNSTLGWIVGKPIVASVALSIVSPIVVYAFRPIYRRFLEVPISRYGGYRGATTVGFLVLCAYLAISFYIHTTMLLGAFLAGMTLAVWPSDREGVINYKHIFEEIFDPLLKRYFASLFFASIGYSIPFLDLFTAKRFWQGLVYSVFMFIGKLLVGIWIPIRDLVTKERFKVDEESDKYKTKIHSSKPNKDSWIAGLILGSAMLARGEIGVLILQVSLTTSQSNAGSDNAISVMDNETYLIGIWAVAWNTIIGPVAFGLMVKYFGQRVIDSHWGDTARLRIERQESIYAAPTLNTEATITQETKVKGTGTQDNSDV
ncbi:Sodium/hydrogen exchanger [Wallemia mellicola]|uniref:Sodium/hydrogen exchanger n=1 Tax=Wallemia mellicola TaxID=1708541 RepID=A0A4T0MEG1_9BASI|nr:Sodium/hydrogen exchanger [Wallemia mellicola]